MTGANEQPLALHLQHRLDQLTKPRGSLGRLEALALQIGLIQRSERPALHAPQVVVFAADHGLAAQGVSAYPGEVTAQMVENFLAGGAAISVLARQHVLALTVVDAGVRAEIAPRAGLLSAKVAAGTADSSLGPAMTTQQCTEAVERGRDVVRRLPGNVLLLGEMGIGNTASAALLLARLGGFDIADCTGRGTGLDDAGLAQALSAQGYTLQNYKADLRRQLMRLRAVNTIVQPKIQITDEDIKARFDQMQRRSEAVSAVRLSDILIKLPDHATEQQINEGKAKAGKAVERVKGGEDFVAVAKDMSDDSSTKDTGGELGWFERGSINPDWEQVVFSMEKGDTRGPVSGPQGLYVFQVTDVKKSELKPFTEMKEQLTRELKRRELDKQTETWVQELRKKAYIDIKLQ